MTDEDKDKDKDVQKNKDQDIDKDKDELDPTIAALMKDPDGIAKLLHSKRDANAEAKKSRLDLEKIKNAQEEAENKSLEEQNKFKELNEKLKAENEELKGKFKKQLILMALTSEALSQKISDPDLVKLIAADKITVNDDFTIEGAKEAVEAFKESKPSFFKDGEEDGDNGEPESSKKPGLRDKIKNMLSGDEEKIKPEQRIENYFASKKK